MKHHEHQWRKQLESTPSTRKPAGPGRVKKAQASRKRTRVQAVTVAAKGNTKSHELERNRGATWAIGAIVGLYILIGFIGAAT